MVTRTVFYRSLFLEVMNWKRACRQTSKVVKMVRGKRVFATGVYFIWHFKNFQQWKIKLPRIRLTAADRGRRWWNSGLGRWPFSGARWRPPVWFSLPGTSALASSWPRTLLSLIRGVHWTAAGLGLLGVSQYALYFSIIRCFSQKRMFARAPLLPIQVCVGQSVDLLGN